MGERSPPSRMDFLDSAREIARIGLCNTIATRQGLSDALSSLRVSALGVTIAPGDLISVGNNYASGLLNCPASAGPYTPLPGPQFTGGQCVGDRYRITATFTRFFPGGGQTDVVDAVGGQLYVGPIEELFLLNGNDDVNVRHNNGQVSDFLSGNPSAFTVGNIRDVSVENVDNAADPCGDLPGDGVGTGQPFNLDYDDPQGAPVSDPVTVTVNAPVILPNGLISFPVNVSGPDYNIDFNFDGSGGPGQPSLPGTDANGDECCPSPLPLINPPDPGDDPPEDDPEGPLLGVWIKSTLPTTGFTSTRVGLVNGPPAIFPRIGSVTFGVNTGGARGWLAPIDFQNSPAFVKVPDDLLAIDAKVNPLAGVTVEVVRIYRQPDVVLS